MAKCYLRTFQCNLHQEDLCCKLLRIDYAVRVGWLLLLRLMTHYQTVGLNITYSCKNTGQNEEPVVVYILIVKSTGNQRNNHIKFICNSVL